MKRILLIILFICIRQINIQAQTYVTGGVFSNTTWTKANSPYIVTGNIIVYQGVTLTIEAGVEVRVNDGLLFDVRGDLTAIGTVNDSIHITSNSASPNNQSWLGFRFTVGFEHVNLQYCSGSYAEKFMFSDLNTYFTIKNSRFWNCEMGLCCDAIGATYNIDSSIFANNTYGIYGIDAGNIMNCKFENNIHGLLCYGSVVTNCQFSGNSIALDGHTSNISYCSITNNDVGIYFMLSGGMTASTITHNNISNNNIGFKIKGNNPAFATVNNNTICHNTIYNVENTIIYSPNLANNCWCLSDSLLIANTIFDAYDNAALGIVNYSPFNSDSSCVYALTNINGPTNIKEYVSAFPNPASNALTISNIKRATTIRLYDILGKLVVEQEIMGNETIDTSNLTNSIYTLVAEDIKGKTFIKVVIRK